MIPVSHNPGAPGAAAGPPAPNLQLWLKEIGFLDASNNPATGGGNVKTWQDQSGNGNDVVSGNGVYGTLTTVNSLSALHLPGTSFHYLSNNQITTHPLTTTIYLVSQMSGTAGVFMSQGTAGLIWYIYGSTGFSIDADFGSGVIIDISSNWANNSVLSIFTLQFAGSSGNIQVNLWRDAASLHSSSGGLTNDKTGQFFLGAEATVFADPTTGDFCEVLFYDAAHDASTRTTVWNYLKAKWGTP